MHGKQVGFDIHGFDQVHGFLRKFFHPGVTLAGHLVADLGEHGSLPPHAGGEVRHGGNLLHGDVPQAELGGGEVEEEGGKRDVLVGEFAGSVRFFEDGGGHPAREETMEDGGGLLEQDVAVTRQHGNGKGFLKHALHAGKVQEGAVVFQAGAVNEVHPGGELAHHVFAEVLLELLLQRFVFQQGAPGGRNVGGVDVVVLFRGGGQEDEGAGFGEIQVLGMHNAVNEEAVLAPADGARFGLGEGVLLPSGVPVESGAEVVGLEREGNTHALFIDLGEGEAGFIEFPAQGVPVFQAVRADVIIEVSNTFVVQSLPAQESLADEVALAVVHVGVVRLLVEQDGVEGAVARADKLAGGFRVGDFPLRGDVVLALPLLRGAGLVFVQGLAGGEGCLLPPGRFP